MPASFFHVTITNPGGTTAPNDGFVDPTRIEKYITSLEAAPSDFTLALSTAKRRANLRYVAIISQIDVVTNASIDPTATLTPAATYKTEPSSITMTMMIEHGLDTLYTADENNAGVFLTGTDALTRMIARALIQTTTVETDVLDPTTQATPGNATLVARFGERVRPITVGPVASNLSAATALISVTALN